MTHDDWLSGSLAVAAIVMGIVGISIIIIMGIGRLLGALN